MILARYGYRKQAEAIAERFLLFLMDKVKKHGVYHENYNAETGEPLAAAGNASWYLLMSHLPAHLDHPLFEIRGRATLDNVPNQEK